MGKRVIEKLLKAEGLWSLGVLVKENAHFVIALFGGGVMTWLARLTEWVSAYGPIAWGLAFLVGAVASLGLLYLYQAIRRIKMANESVTSAISDGVNPLQKSFKSQPVNLVHFFDPSYSPYQDLRFEDCRISGPILVKLDGAVITDVTFRHCQIVIAREDLPIFGAIRLVKPRIVGGVMYNVTLLMTDVEYNNLPEDIRENVHVIHN